MRAEYVVPAKPTTAWWWPVRYLAQAIATITVIVRHRPQVVFFTNPPFVSGVACLLAAKVVDAKCWADCHSGAYNDPRWERFRAVNQRVLARCTGVIFHNDRLARQHGSMVRRHVVVSIYAMVDRRTPGSEKRREAGARPLVAVICSYGFDEPIGELLEAARMLPQADLAFTGKAPVGLLSDMPSNVRLTGWLSDARYHELLSGAAAVVCMTTREATMQNGLIEALEHARPVLTSNTAALREWARNVPGVLTVDNDAAAIAGRLEAIIDRQSCWDRRAADGSKAAAIRADAELRRLRQTIVAAKSGSE